MHHFNVQINIHYNVFIYISQMSVIIHKKKKNSCTRIMIKI